MTFLNKQIAVRLDRCEISMGAVLKNLDDDSLAVLVEVLPTKEGDIEYLIARVDPAYYKKYEDDEDDTGVFKSPKKENFIFDIIKKPKKWLVMSIGNDEFVMLD